MPLCVYGWGSGAYLYFYFFVAKTAYFESKNFGQIFYIYLFIYSVLTFHISNVKMLNF